MKRARELLLDFTPLLDVVLIILFYFILFSRFQTASAQDAAQRAMQEAAGLTAAAEQELADAQALSEQARRALEAVADPEARRYIQAMLDFDQGANIKLRLRSSGRSWTLSVRQGDRSLGLLTEQDTDGANLKRLLEDAGIRSSDTVLCEFLYDASQSGSRAAFLAVQSALRELGASYRYLYISETDLSD